MNKTEQKEFERLKTLLALKHWPEVLPDVVPPSISEPFATLTTGYMYNSYSKTVNPACSSSIGHSIGRTDKTTTQKPIKMYSTKKLALRAMLHELSMCFAHEMRQLEKMLEVEDK